MHRLIRKIGRTVKRRLGVVPGSGPAGIWTGYVFDAAQLAEHVDCSYADLAAPQQHPERVHADIGQRICNWYLPVFDNPFYGGVMTILRLAAHLQAGDGVQQRFLICGRCDVTKIAGLIQSAFPSLRAAQILSLASADAIAAIPPADYSVATLWTTAYALLKVNNTGYKFYLIQDYEPLFYPAGSTAAQAELTYRFGFYGIANTETIRNLYESRFGGKAVALTPCVDPKIFWTGDALPADGVKRLFYYARPGTPRNGFELAAAVLRRVKERFGSRLDIVTAGAHWDPADFGVAEFVRNAGLLSYEQTGELYRTCHVGLVMMMTSHPSYLPFELMACGCIVVSNLNPANSWLLQNEVNCLLSPPTASCLADTLARAIDDYEKLERLRSNAALLIKQSHSDWSQQMNKVAGFMHSPPPLLPL
jgi:O-antigen biosynthesis protein